MGVDRAEGFSFHKGIRFSYRNISVKGLESQVPEYADIVNNTLFLIPNTS